jgi:hypothetical protein
VLEWRLKPKPRGGLIMISQIFVLLVLSALLTVTTYAAAKPTGKTVREQAVAEVVEEDTL